MRPTFGVYACSIPLTCLLLGCAPRAGLVQPLSPSRSVSVPHTPATERRIEESAPSRLTPAQIAERARPSVLLVQAGDSGSGTGFVVGPDLVATALHVVAGAEQISLRIANGRVVNVTEIQAFDRAYDLAILRTADEDLDLPALPLGDSTKLAQGESVVAVSNPMGLEATISTGVVSAIREIQDGLTLVQVTAPISPGSSGGPLINDRGEVIAVAEMYLNEGQALNFGSPSAAILRLLGDRPKPLTVAEFAALTVSHSASNAGAGLPAGPGTSLPRATFPEHVAGFPFGVDHETLQRLCPDLVTRNPISCFCPYSRVELDFAEPMVAFTLAAGQVVAMQLTVRDLSNARASLVGKYGPPTFETYTRDGRWIAARGWTQAMKGGMHWAVDGGSIRLGSRDGQTRFLAFVSPAREAAQRENF